MRLSNETLTDLPENIRVPRYDRTSLTAGIVHIGVGNFHRAHQAWYLHRLMDQGLAHDWAIVGAGVRPNDAVAREKMLAQDCLTTLIELDPTGKSAEVTGSMIDYLPVEAGNVSLIARMTTPDIRIVSLTVTEGGYYRDAEGRFDAEHADIRYDAGHIDAPRTAFGAIVAALRHRREAGAGPFTCLSCDNHQGNGDVLRRAVVGLARIVDADLAGWIDAECTFPNSMVDCIVPATGPNETALVRTFGIDDMVPVTHENFRQWVIEDQFCAGRPAWDQVGASFTSRVHDYERMKLLILNAGHQVVANPGALLSVETIAGCIDHPLIKAHFRKVEEQEIIPLVKPVPEITPLAYLDLVEQRFSNSEIRDTSKRVGPDAASRHPGFVLPIVREALREGTPVEGLALVEALWARMCEGTREDGSLMESSDPNWNDLRAAARAAKDRPRSWIEQRRYYGNLAEAPRFADAFGRWLDLIWEQGTEATMASFVQS